MGRRPGGGGQFALCHIPALTVYRVFARLPRNADLLARVFAVMAGPRAGHPPPPAPQPLPPVLTVRGVVARLTRSAHLPAPPSPSWPALDLAIGPPPAPRPLPPVLTVLGVVARVTRSAHLPAPPLPSWPALEPAIRPRRRRGPLPPSSRCEGSLRGMPIPQSPHPARRSAAAKASRRRSPRPVPRVQGRCALSAFCRPPAPGQSDWPPRTGSLRRNGIPQSVRPDSPAARTSYRAPASSPAPQ